MISPNEPGGPALPLFSDRDCTPHIPRLVGLLLPSGDADHDPCEVPEDLPLTLPLLPTEEAG